MYPRFFLPGKGNRIYPSEALDAHPFCHICACPIFFSLLHVMQRLHHRWSEGRTARAAHAYCQQGKNKPGGWAGNENPRRKYDCVLLLSELIVLIEAYCHSVRDSSGYIDEIKKHSTARNRRYIHQD